MDRVCGKTGYPKTTRVDQGSEFASRHMDLWAVQRGVTLSLSRPGKPTDNAFIEAFHGRSRAECLNQHWFLSLEDVAKSWRLGVGVTISIDPSARSAQGPGHADEIGGRSQPVCLMNGGNSDNARGRFA
ncbi:hypothetical protein GCM10008024_30750 [Allgaiera indica]|uniref:Integrase catalytic domain-containing protein n=1 Tax=Allgaiera indica TaxID=765699 RepID=A0AAN5A1E7_9RHOB|nr:hypothetical protein GCM10008024_30750 [Allgaiera indica]